MKKFFLLILIGILFSTNIPNYSFAQDRDLVGDIDDEGEEDISSEGSESGAPSQAGVTSVDLNIEKIDRYADSQSEAIKDMESLLSNLKGSSNGTISRVKDLSDDAINYLTAAYLYCISNKGVCVEMLEAILEIDIINSKLSSSADCPNMVKFWRKWLSNDFEERAKLSMKTGYLTQVQEFTTKVRPSFVQCKPTVEKAIAQGGTIAEFLTSRYAGGTGRPVQSVEITVKTLQAIKSSVSNVFVAMGAQGSSQEGKDKGKKGAKTSNSANKKTK